MYSAKASSIICSVSPNSSSEYSWAPKRPCSLVSCQRRHALIGRVVERSAGAIVDPLDDRHGVGADLLVRHIQDAVIKLKPVPDLQVALHGRLVHHQHLSAGFARVHRMTQRRSHAGDELGERGHARARIAMGMHVGRVRVAIEQRVEIWEVADRLEDPGPTPGTAILPLQVLQHHPGVLVHRLRRPVHHPWVVRGDVGANVPHPVVEREHVEEAILLHLHRIDEMGGVPCLLVVLGDQIRHARGGDARVRLAGVGIREPAGVQGPPEIQLLDALGC